MNPPFSAVEKIRLLLRITFLTPWTVVFYVSRAAVISLCKGLPLWTFIHCAVLKAILRTFTGRQMQYVSPTTRQTYQSWVQRKLSKAGHDVVIRERLQIDIEPLHDEKSAILWLGNRHKAKKIVLFYHGGGYVAPMQPGHLEWCWRSYVAAGIETGTETAVAVLEYTLCPEAQYPVQLSQGIDALNHILKAGVRARDIIIGGDSAGGNLTAQVLSHLCDPTPSIPRIMLNEPLAAAFLVSPWVSIKMTDESYIQNGWMDMLSMETVSKAKSYYLTSQTIQQRVKSLRSRSTATWDIYVGCLQL